MATNLALDQDWLDHAFRASGESIKKAAVTRALQEFIARREQSQVAELFGKREWDPGDDDKAERSSQLVPGPDCDGHSRRHFVIVISTVIPTTNHADPFVMG